MLGCTSWQKRSTSLLLNLLLTYPIIKQCDSDDSEVQIPVNQKFCEVLLSYLFYSLKYIVLF